LRDIEILGEAGVRLRHGTKSHTTVIGIRVLSHLRERLTGLLVAKPLQAFSMVSQSAATYWFS